MQIYKREIIHDMTHVHYKSSIIIISIHHFIPQEPLILHNAMIRYHQLTLHGNYYVFLVFLKSVYEIK